MADAFGEELDLARLPGMETHLTSCAECKAAWEDYRLLRRGLDALAAEDDGPSPFVEAKILRAAAAGNAAPA
ncbi:MAG TPA: hypothetical protein VFW62_07520, partial [bacterium]|nr:hypothetical protein [bacterium]